MARSILNRHRQQGFSILEAVFSALILGIALLALAGFHAVALQDGSLVKARSVAANLAQEKLDDLRSFTYLTDGDFSDDGNAASSTNYCGQGTFCFSEIAADAGGRENSGGALVMSSGTISGYIDNYSRTWTVDCYNESTAAQLAAVTCADPDGNPATDDIPSAKRVTVTVAWTDSKGVAQSVVLQSMIYAMDPAMAARASISPYPSQGPSVTYTPIGVPDAVPVPISTGDGRYKESSKPLPDVSSRGISLRTEFDAVSYTTVDGVTTKDSQLEFATVNCVCEFAGSGQGYPASYFYWDAGKLKIKTPDATVTKMTGTAPSIQGDQQDSLCDSCCRDHHDSEAPGTSNPSTALYDPDRPAADYIGNNHKHYYYLDENNPALGLSEVVESIGNRYLEACRFARVDGFYRLLQDWRALDMVVMPKLDYLEQATPLANYQAYLVKYLKYQTQVDCGDADGATGCSSINQPSAPAKSELSDRNLDEQAVGNRPQLMARALYADRVYKDDEPRTLDGDYYTTLASKISAGNTWLDLLPFNEVNVTLLASWHSDDPTSVSVDNEEILSIAATTADYYGVYYRGRALVTSTGDGIADIYAYLLPSNSGLTGGVTRDTYTGMVDYDASTLADTGTAIAYASELGIDKHDHASSGRKEDFITISRSGTAPPASTGSVRVGNSSVDLATVGVSEIGGVGAACTVTYTAGDNSGSFECSQNYTGDVQISQTSGTGYFYHTADDVDGNGSFDPSLDTGGSYTDTNSCPGGDCGNFWVFGPTIKVIGKCHGNQCSNSTFDFKTTSPTVGTDTPCVLDSTDNSTVTCTVTLDTTAHTWTGKIKITGNGSNYVLADATSCDSSAGTSAKYTAADIVAGPADKQSAFNVCATDVSSLPSPPGTPGSVALAEQASDVTFSWGDVADESGYTVYYCEASGDVSCAPSTYVSTQDVNVTSVSLSKPGNTKTRCFNVKAFNAGGSSAASQSMCIYRSGGAYTVTGPF